MIVSTKNATPLKSTASKNPNSSVPIQIGLNFQFEIVLRDTSESEFLDSVDFGPQHFQWNLFYDKLVRRIF